MTLTKDGERLLHPDVVPFSPSWTVKFNYAFSSGDQREWLVDEAAFKTCEKVLAWVREHASAQMLTFVSGEVVCEDESDATLLFLAFR